MFPICGASKAYFWRLWWRCHASPLCYMLCYYMMPGETFICSNYEVDLWFKEQLDGVCADGFASPKWDFLALYLQYPRLCTGFRNICDVSRTIVCCCWASRVHFSPATSYLLICMEASRTTIFVGGCGYIYLGVWESVCGIKYECGINLKDSHISFCWLASHDGTLISWDCSQNEVEAQPISLIHVFNVKRLHLESSDSELNIFLNKNTFLGTIATEMMWFAKGGYHRMVEGRRREVASFAISLLYWMCSEQFKCSGGLEDAYFYVVGV